MPTNTWTNKNPASPPPARGYHAMAYDGVNQKIVLFGGYNGSRLNDTWTYDLTANSWTDKAPASPPSTGYLHAMGYDSVNREDVMFGGGLARPPSSFEREA